MRQTHTTSRVTRRFVAGSCALLLAALVPAAGAHAAPATHAICTNAITLHITPGFSTRVTSGSVTSRGETGTLLCAGTLHGHTITGPGTFSVEETYTRATCLADASTGRVSATIPTTAGRTRITGALTGRRLGLVEFIEIAFPDARFHAAGPVLPTLGDCLITPITRAFVSVAGTLTS